MLFLFAASLRVWRAADRFRTVTHEEAWPSVSTDSFSVSIEAYVPSSCTFYQSAETRNNAPSSSMCRYDAQSHQSSQRSFDKSRFAHPDPHYRLNISLSPGQPPFSG